MQFDRKILLIEDDFDISETLRLILESDGYTVVGYPNGKLALDWLSHSQSCPSLILLDLMMPVMNGYEFLEKKSKLPENFKNIPVVVLSAMGGPSTSLPGVKEYLRKPVDIHLLLNTVKQFVLPHS